VRQTPRGVTLVQILLLESFSSRDHDLKGVEEEGKEIKKEKRVRLQEQKRGRKRSINA